MIQFSFNWQKNTFNTRFLVYKPGKCKYPYIYMNTYFYTKRNISPLYKTPQWGLLAKDKLIKIHTNCSKYFNLKTYLLKILHQYYTANNQYFVGKNHVPLFFIFDKKIAISCMLLNFLPRSNLPSISLLYSFITL